MFSQEPIPQDPDQPGVFTVYPQATQVCDRLYVPLDLLQLPLQLLKVHHLVPFNISYLCLIFNNKSDDGFTVIFGDVFGLASEFMLELEPFL